MPLRQTYQAATTTSATPHRVLTSVPRGAAPGVVLCGGCSGPVASGYSPAHPPPAFWSSVRCHRCHHVNDLGLLTEIDGTSPPEPSPATTTVGPADPAALARSAAMQQEHGLRP